MMQSKLSNPGSTEPQDPAAQQTSPTKLATFLLWRDASARFLPRTRSYSVQRPPHPLQSSLQPSLSTPDLTTMATAAAAASSHPPHPKIHTPEPESLNTLADPRTPSSASTISRSDSVVDGHHPDLNEEVSKLNEKLVDAINHQVSLDDALQQARHELEITRRQLEKFETESKEHADQLSHGLLVPKQVVDKIAEKHRLQAIADRDARLKAEKEKKAMEQELETLTSALFQEANTMVSDARKDKEASDKKVEQLKSQLRDSEVLLVSHQDQLADLKLVLEKVADQADGDSVTNNSSNPPSSPAVPSTDRINKAIESNSFPHVDVTAPDAAPEHPLHFSHLIQPVLRTDVTAYQDFATLIKQVRAASPPPSRVVSGSFSSLSAVANGANSAGSSQNPSPATPSFPSVNTSPMPGSMPGSLPIVPQAPTIRETKVFKRALTEDIDPTLRLDIAPGVSWMSRRPIVNSMIDGSLVVEPMPPSPVKFRGPVNQCTLCGENRVGEAYARNHRFRISENRETRRFPLCDLCLGRLRSCCDLLAFLRMITGGHWRADTDDEIKTAWEEYVKLRERMFWHRISGGVVPASNQQSKDFAVSPRHSISSAPGEAIRSIASKETIEPTTVSVKE